MFDDPQLHAQCALEAVREAEARCTASVEAAYRQRLRERRQPLRMLRALHAEYAPLALALAAQSPGARGCNPTHRNPDSVRVGADGIELIWAQGARGPDVIFFASWSELKRESLATLSTAG